MVLLSTFDPGHWAVISDQLRPCQHCVLLLAYLWKLSQAAAGTCVTMFPLFSCLSALTQRTKCFSLSGVSAPERRVSLSSFFFFFSLFFFYSAPHVVLMLRAPEPQKAALESEDQSERLSDFTIPSLSGAHRLSRCFLFLCLSQEDGTVHRASCTRSESVTDRLAAGLLNSPCRVTLGFCFYCSA